jgi:hypothetical protein
MFNQEDNPPPKDSVKFILGMAFATAAVATLGSKLVDWAVEEIKGKYGTKPPEEKKEP